MSDCRAHFTNVLGEVLDRLSPLIEQAGAVLDRKGTRALRTKIEREFHFALCLQRALQRHEDEVPNWALAEEIGKSPVLMGEARKPRPGLALVVDNGGTQ